MYLIEAILHCLEMARVHNRRIVFHKRASRIAMTSRIAQLHRDSADRERLARDANMALARSMREEG